MRVTLLQLQYWWFIQLADVLAWKIEENWSFLHTHIIMYTSLTLISSFVYIGVYIDRVQWCKNFLTITLTFVDNDEIFYNYRHLFNILFCIKKKDYRWYHIKFWNFTFIWSKSVTMKLLFSEFIIWKLLP